MIRVRIGNDIKLRWAIFKPDHVTPEDFSDVISAKVSIKTHEPKWEMPQKFNIDGNILTIDFLASEQVHLGTHDLFITYTKLDPEIEGGLATFTVDSIGAFELVPHSKNVNDTAEVYVEGVVAGLSYEMLTEAQKQDIIIRLVNSGFLVKINVVDELPETGTPGEFYATFIDDIKPGAIINVVSSLPDTGTPDEFYATFDD